MGGKEGKVEGFGGQIMSISIHGAQPRTRRAARALWRQPAAGDRGGCVWKPPRWIPKSQWVSLGSFCLGEI